MSMPRKHTTAPVDVGPNAAAYSIRLLDETAETQHGNAAQRIAARHGPRGRLDERGTGAANRAQLPHRVTKPWGYEIWYALTDDYAGKILHVKQGHRLSLQYHERKDESCYVLTGRLLLVQGPTMDRLIERILIVGSVWRNLPPTVHTIEALEDSDVLEVSTPELDDVIRLRDNYGRQGTSNP